MSDEPVPTGATRSLGPVLWAAGSLVVVATLLAPVSSGGFVWDDLDQIRDSRTLGATPWWQYFTLNVVESTGGEGRNARGVDLYRPGFLLALEAVHAVGGRRPAVYRSVALALHLLVCGLAWSVARRWLEADAPAWLVILLAGLHPVTVPAVTWPSALSEPLATAGVLAAALLLDPGRSASAPPRAGRSVVAGLLVLAALLTKEAVVMVLPVLAWFLCRRRRVAPRALLPAAVAVGVFAVARAVALGGVFTAGADATHRLAAGKVFPVLVLDGMRALVVQQPVAVRHLFWEYRDLGWPLVAAASAGVAVVVAGAWAVRKRLPLVAVAVAGLLAMLAPVALVVTVPGWGGFGRYLYLASILAAIAAVAAGREVSRRLRGPLRWLPAAVAVVFVATAALTIRPALAAWSTQERLAGAGVEWFPAGPDAWEWLGHVHLERGELVQAGQCYRTAVAVAPEAVRPRHNLAAALLAQGRPAAALAELEQLHRRHRPGPRSRRLEVEALAALGRLEDARRVLATARAEFPGDPGLARLTVGSR